MLSVIIPFHNAAKYIENCLNLLKKQTLKDDYEVLFINDGSTDNSADIFNKLNFDTARIRLINLPKSGVSKARNIGINESKGDYVTFLDIDDTFSEEMLETYSINIKKYRKPFYIYDYFEQIGNVKRYVKIHQGANDLSDISTKFIIGLILGKYGNDPFFASVWRICLNRDLLIKNNILFKEDIYIAEDMLFYLNCFKFIDVVFYVSKALYTYVRRPNSSLNIYRENFIDMQMNLHRYFLEYLENNKEVDEELLSLYSVNKFRSYTALLSNEARSSNKIKECRLKIKEICSLFRSDPYALNSYKKLNLSYRLIYIAMKWRCSLMLLLLFRFKERIRLWKLREKN